MARASGYCRWARKGSISTASNRSATTRSAIQIYFDDEHNTGIYAWETLYQLGINHEQNWKQYLEELKAAGHTRKEKAS